METSNFSHEQEQPTEGVPITVEKNVLKSRERFESCEVPDEKSLLIPHSSAAGVARGQCNTGNVDHVPLQIYILGPILVSMSFGFITNSLIFTQRVFDITEEKLFPGSSWNQSKNESICYKNQSFEEYLEEQDVQQITSMYNIYASLCCGIPGIFSNLVFLAMSDVYGRKLFIFITVTGQFLATGMLAIGMYSNWNIYILLTFQLVSGLTGGEFTYLSIGFAVIADITRAGRSRAFAIVLTEIAVGIGTLAGSAISGYLIHLLHYRMAMVVSASVACLGVVATLIFPETLQKEHSRKYNVSQTFKNIFLFYTKDISSVGKRWKFRACLAALFFIFLSNFGKFGIETLYQLNSPFCWTPVKVGWYTTLRTGLPLVIGMGLVKPFQACMQEHVIGILGSLSYTAGYVLEALATNELMMLIVAFVSFMGALPVPIIRAIMSHMTPPEQQGSLFAGVAAVETICAVVGSVTGNAIYSATVDWFPGFSFLLFACYTGIAGVFIIILLIDSRLEKTETQQKVPV
ncbi:solute carrier family 46 member 3-like [Pecten maximus]|uniref:solute carrier family 46 member 3-like n=1 Tax=Pecten maximus TaxID=6579 RepID=UPI00145847B8|nr:solute carrier family 46 member 3-like [Pecten maximus]XP_033735179.1 solute carrier family 46 member 3-like [Pecten maximus]